MGVISTDGLNTHRWLSAWYVGLLGNLMNTECTIGALPVRGRRLSRQIHGTSLSPSPANLCIILMVARLGINVMLPPLLLLLNSYGIWHMAELRSCERELSTLNVI